MRLDIVVHVEQERPDQWLASADASSDQGDEIVTAKWSKTQNGAVRKALRAVARALR